MNILVTGGSGFIGSNFIHYVLGEQKVGEDSKLVNLDALTYAGNPQNLAANSNDTRYHFVHGDISDRPLCFELLTKFEIDAVINFAAESHVDRSIDSPEAFFQTNVIGTLRLTDAVREYWRNLPAKTKDTFRFLHVSTDEVYGSLSADDPAFRETDPFEPNSPYSASKASSDHIIRACYHTYNMPVITTNCSNNYGPYQYPEKLIPLMILSALAEKPLPIYGDGMNVRDWLFVRDHCTAIWSTLKSGRRGETYNVGGSNEMPNITVVDTICELLDELSPRANGKSYKDLKTYVTDRPGHDRRYAIDCTKISEELNWKPEESFQTGLRKTVLWYLENS